MSNEITTPDDIEPSAISANTLRMLAADAVQKANSGHPGAPMGMAEMAVTLWQRHLKHNPNDPQWADRDRFVLSNGHASMLIYSLLHLSGYDLPMEELKNFRQLHSKTPGHPEVDVTPGVETTTGPLGQGLANAVGMALAEKLLADEFNRPGHEVIDHRTWVFLGDGCLMEGISHEVCSLAGALGLHKLVALYDDNGISIDGEVSPWFDDNTAERFRACGWNVIGAVDGHDVGALDQAICAAKLANKPTLIICRTAIGQGSPNRAGTSRAHGEPLGAEELAATREALDWTAQPFEVPSEATIMWNARERGAMRQNRWQERFDAYATAFPAEADELRRRLNNELPADASELFEQVLAEMSDKPDTVATRKASQIALSALAPKLPEMLGGSADLTGSNLTNWPDCGAVRKGAPGGRHINYGVREFGMAAIMNGMALHGGYLPFGGTFLTFSDYSRNAIRMAALMKCRVVHVLTHDSIGLGEDGPTHQPVEHTASLRLIPGVDVWRPCDQVETTVAWQSCIKRTDGPGALILSRQGLQAYPHSSDTHADIARGAYVLRDADNARANIIATGSEVQLAMQAADALSADGIEVRVISMPCADVFERQDASYRDSVLNRAAPTLVVEAGATAGWWRYAGDRGRVIGLDRFGESAPAGELFKLFGFTIDNVSAQVREMIEANA